MDPRAADLLGRPIIGQLGFFGLDGYPRVIPVWFEYRGGEVLIASQPATYKGRALSRDGRAALSVSLRYLGPEGASRYLEVWSKGGHPGDGELIRLLPRGIHFSTS